jgi:hypothetical protein
MKLLIAIPSLDYIHVDFVNCLQKLIIRLKDDGVNFEVKIISDLMTETFRGCRWTSVQRQRNRQGLHRICSGYALSREVKQ